MIKLIVCDLDGTLLRDDQSISKETINCIKKAQNKGISFVIATGRHDVLAQVVCDQYGIECDIITNNGAQILSKNFPDLVMPMENSTVYKIAKVLFNFDFHVAIFTTAGKFTFVDLDSYYQQHIDIATYRRGFNIDHLLESPLFNKKYFIKNTHVIKVEEILNFPKNEIQILKIDARNIEDKKNSRMGMKIVKEIPELTVSSSHEGFMEINAVGTNKSTGLQKYIELMGIDRSEVAVFGDSANDIEMISDFPNSFVVANAKENLKQLAKYIVKSNDDDGVREGIELILSTSM